MRSRPDHPHEHDMSAGVNRITKAVTIPGLTNLAIEIPINDRATLLRAVDIVTGAANQIFMALWLPPDGAPCALNNPGNDFIIGAAPDKLVITPLEFPSQLTPCRTLPQGPKRLCAEYCNTGAAETTAAYTVTVEY